jgi:4-coumarate--CoA ligase
MGPELMAQAEAKLGAHISQTWGLSETTGSVTAMPWDEHDVTGSISPLLPNVRMRIVDDNDNDVPEGEEGEFLVKGPIVTKGYWDNEKQTQESFTPDGWYKTGDIGLWKDNKFYIVDRKKVRTQLRNGTSPLQTLT